MNLNAAPTEAVGLVGYLPTLNVSVSARRLSAFKDCQHYILQTCIGHVLKLIEDRSLCGFSAVIDGHKRVLFPRLGAMTLDTKERVKYFGLRSDRSCGFCRLRFARSVTRKATRHDVDVLRLLQSWATITGNKENGVHLTQVQISQRKKAKDKLFRHGFSRTRRCHLHEYTQNCLVDIPRFGNVPFAGLVHYERMHAFFLNYCTYCMEALNELVTDSLIIDQRLKACHQFRDPRTGETHPRLPSLLKMTHVLDPGSAQPVS